MRNSATSEGWISAWIAFFNVCFIGTTFSLLAFIYRICQFVVIVASRGFCSQSVLVGNYSSDNVMLHNGELANQK